LAVNSRPAGPLADYTLDSFVAFLAAIPKDRWMVNGYADGQGRHDAAGHLGAVPFQHYSHAPAARALNELLKPIGRHIFDVNDLNLKLGDHPKERMLKALELAREFYAKQST
jgi:hypothetical protein